MPEAVTVDGLPVAKGAATVRPHSRARTSALTRDTWAIGGVFTTAVVARIAERAGSEAKLGFKVHPRMLRPHRDLDGSLGRHCRPHS